MKWGDRKHCKDLIKPAFPCAYSGTGKPVMIPVQRYPSLLHVNNKADFRLFRPVLFINAIPVFCAAWNGWQESQLAWDSLHCIPLHGTHVPLMSLCPQALMQRVL